MTSLIILLFQSFSAWCSFSQFIMYPCSTSHVKFNQPRDPISTCCCLQALGDQKSKVYHPREVVPFEAFSRPSFRPFFHEVDVVGFVINVDAKQCMSTTAPSNCFLLSDARRHSGRGWNWGCLLLWFVVIKHSITKFHLAALGWVWG